MTSENLTVDDPSITKVSEGFSEIFSYRKKAQSRELHLYLKDLYLLFNNFIFTVRLADRADYVQKHAAQVLHDTAQSEEEKKKYQESISKSGEATKHLASFSTINSRNLLTCSIDLFLWYLSAIIQAAIMRRPEILKSGETLRLDEVMRFKKRSELVSFIVDKKINSLSYGGIREMEKYVDDRLGLQLFADDETRALMNIYIELRNVHVHNRGYINNQYLYKAPRHPDFRIKLGYQYSLGFEQLVALATICLRTAVAFDASVGEKFRIKRKRYRTWESPAAKNKKHADGKK